jgi:hypothetical protein
MLFYTLTLCFLSSGHSEPFYNFCLNYNNQVYSEPTPVVIYEPSPPVVIYEEPVVIYEPSPPVVIYREPIQICRSPITTFNYSYYRIPKHHYQHHYQHHYRHKRHHYNNKRHHYNNKRHHYNNKRIDNSIVHTKPKYKNHRSVRVTKDKTVIRREKRKTISKAPRHTSGLKRQKANKSEKRNRRR